MKEGPCFSPKNGAQEPGKKLFKYVYTKEKARKISNVEHFSIIAKSCINIRGISKSDFQISAYLAEFVQAQLISRSSIVFSNI